MPAMAADIATAVMLATLATAGWATPVTPATVG
jgi:hypothetical protein